MWLHLRCFTYFHRGLKSLLKSYFVLAAAVNCHTLTNVDGG